MTPEQAQEQARTLWFDTIHNLPVAAGDDGIVAVIAAALQSAAEQGAAAELQALVLELEGEVTKGRQCMKNARLVTEFDRAEGITAALMLAVSIVRAHQGEAGQ
jgi:hypothetical protein